MLLPFHQQALAGSGFGQIPVGIQIVGVVAQDFFVDRHGVIQQTGGPVFGCCIQEMLDSAAIIAGFEAQIPQLIDRRRVIFVDFQNALIDGNGRFPVTAFSRLVSILLQLAELRQKENPRNRI